MKSFSKVMIGAALYLGMATGYALPIGNIADPALYQRGCVSDYFGNDSYSGDSCCDPCGFNFWQYLNFRVGYYGDFVFNRHMQFKETGSKPDVDHFSHYTNAGYLVLNLCNRVDIFATLGATNFSTEFRSSFVFSGQLPRVRIETSDKFSWSIGGKAILWECGCTYLGIEGQYFRTTQHVSRAIGGDLLTENPSNGKHFTYREWQVGLGLAHRIAFVVPYIGVKWSGSKGNVNFPVLLLNPTFPIESKNRWGFATGVTILACDTVGLTVEGRWGDDKAVHVNGQIRF